MTRSLSADLRGRVIAAIEDGVSTREAARRFRIGISTAGSWYRRYRETGETEARKQGQPSRSKVDAHHPAAWKDFEALGAVGPLDDLEHEASDSPASLNSCARRRPVTLAASSPFSMERREAELDRPRSPC